MNSKQKKTSNRKIIFWFSVGAALVFAICFVLLRFAKCWQIEEYNNYVSLPDLILTFFGCTAVIFFSLATFLNWNISKERNIIDNYALINFCKEISVLQEKKIADKKHTELCFLVTNSLNSPIYQVKFRKIKFDDTHSYEFQEKNAEYSENTLSRGYNCLSLNLPLGINDTKKLIKENSVIKIELDIISIFKVLSSVKYEITIAKEREINNEDKDTTNDNFDKKVYKKMVTYQIHHSIYSLENQYKI